MEIFLYNQIWRNKNLSIKKYILKRKAFSQKGVNLGLRSRFPKFPDSPRLSGCQGDSPANLPDPWELRPSTQLSLGTPFPGSPSGLAERRSPRTGLLCDWLPFRPALRGAAVWADVGPVPHQPISARFASGACLCSGSLRGSGMRQGRVCSVWGKKVPRG